MKILLVSPEVIPFAKTGGLADVAGALAKAFNKSGQKCSIIMPFYQLVTKNGFEPKPLRTDIKIHLGAKEYTFNILFLRHEKTDVYFIDNKELYDRPELYGTVQGDFADNAIRFGFFAKAVLSVIDYIGEVDIVHCNDWQSALIPLYLKLFRKDKDIKTVFTIHNMAYQGLFPSNVMSLIDLPPELLTWTALEFYGQLSFMKAGIIYSDAVATVSKRYSREILTKEFGCGLEGLLQTRSLSLYGIINGVDYSEWNPSSDKYIIKNYDENNLDKKQECKKNLLKTFGLSFNEKIPVIGMVTRLAEQKGIDLVSDNISQILSLGTYFVLLGTGGEKYNNLFKAISQTYKKYVGVKIGFDNSLAHKIEAGSDIFLMPSRYEPCGLNQMYSLKYGTVPVVRATGGLDDTIENFNSITDKGNGFKFVDASSGALLKTMATAVKLYKDRKRWQSLQKNGMQCDFSWDRSAKEYIGLYKKILKNDTYD